MELNKQDQEKTITVSIKETKTIITDTGHKKYSILKHKKKLPD